MVLAALGPRIKYSNTLSISYMPRVARTVRGSVVVVKEYEHVEAARALGQKTGISFSGIYFLYVGLNHCKTYSYYGFDYPVRS